MVQGPSAVPPTGGGLEPVDSRTEILVILGALVAFVAGMIAFAADLRRRSPAASRGAVSVAKSVVFAGSASGGPWGRSGPKRSTADTLAPDA